MSLHYFELQNDMFYSLDDINFEGNIQHKSSSTSNDQIISSFNNEEFDFTSQVDQLYGAEDSSDFGATNNSLSSYGFYNQDHDQNNQQQIQQQQAISDDGLLLNYSQYNVVSPSLEACLEEIAKLDHHHHHQVGPDNDQTVIKDVDRQAKKSTEYPFSLASLQLLNNYGSRFKRMKGERIVIRRGNDDNYRGLKLSTEEILRIAGARFIESSSCPIMPYEESTNKEDVELVEILLSCAEKVGFQQHENAAALLDLCAGLASKTGSPVQRVVYYFCEALLERIGRETGGSRTQRIDFDIDKTIRSPEATKIALQQELPFFQAEKLAGVQAIIETLAHERAKKLHIIDLRLGFGLQWTDLIKLLASSDDNDENRVELLKITALASTASKHSVEETGKRLSNFACSMNVPFRFNVVTRLEEEEEYSFEADTEETIAVYSSYSLSPMISVPARLERLMRAIRGLKPIIMVVTEVEAKQNSRAFFTRFVESLFYYGALFDCLEASMRHDDTNRAIFESLYCGLAIRNVVAAEGDERKVRNVSVEVWRAFFARFGMEEIEMSKACLDRARLVAESFECGSYCTFEMNGNCLMMGWKGTPLHSLSAWRFF